MTAEPESPLAAEFRANVAKIVAFKNKLFGNRSKAQRQLPCLPEEQIEVEADAYSTDAEDDRVTEHSDSDDEDETQLQQ